MSHDTGFATFEGWRVAYETRGEGTRAIVFVHGWSANRRHWHRQMRGLSTDRRLVAVDLLGHGESDKPERAYPMPWLAGAVAAALDQAGVTRAVAVGHSMGVPVVRQLQRLRPDLVEALVAADGPFRNSTPPPVRAWMRQALERPDAAEFMRAMAAQTPVAGLSDEDAAVIRDGSAATPLHVHAGGLDGTDDPASWSDDPIPVPLLVILAKSDRVSFASDAEQAFVRALAPHAEIEVWDDASHFLILQHAERFNRRVERFLETLP